MKKNFLLNVIEKEYRQKGGFLDRSGAILGKGRKIFPCSLVAEDIENFCEQDYAENYRACEWQHDAITGELQLIVYLFQTPEQMRVFRMLELLDKKWGMQGWCAPVKE